jgi:hypothetical protein
MDSNSQKREDLMAGKYDKLKGKLPAFQQEASFQQKVDEAKSQFVALNAPELARMFNLGRQNKKSLESRVSEVNIELEALSQLLTENFEASGLTKLTLATGETCYTQTEPYSSVQDQQSLLTFIKKQKMSNLLTLAWGTLNALNKERLVAGKPPLPGTVVYLKTAVRLRNGNQGNQSEEGE